MSEEININQLFTSTLSQFSYFIENNNESIIIDPIVDINIYLNILSNTKSTLKYILNTHLHTDFISGSLYLANITGATLIYGPYSSIQINNERYVSQNNNSNECNCDVCSHSQNNKRQMTKYKKSSTLKDKSTVSITNFSSLSYPFFSSSSSFKSQGFKVKFLSNNEKIKFGHCKIQLNHTPGHTLDSSIYFLLDGNDKIHSVFTGDTLLIGDISIPDNIALSVRKDMMFMKDLAIYQYYSIQFIKRSVPEDVEIYPSHINSHNQLKSTTIRKEVSNNDFMKEVDVNEFIKLMVKTRHMSDSLYFHIGFYNYNGILPIGSSHIKSLSVIDFMNYLALNENICIIDTRRPLDNGVVESFEYIKNSILLSIKSIFSFWIGCILNPNQPILIISNISTNKKKDNDIMTYINKLLRVGFTNIVGYLNVNMNIDDYKNSYKSHFEEINRPDLIEKFNVIELKILRQDKILSYLYDNQQSSHIDIIDVRESHEYEKERISFIKSLPLTTLSQKSNLNLFEKKKKYLFLCQTGVRSCIAVSFLVSLGVDNNFLYVVDGGYEKIKINGVIMNNNMNII